MGNSDAAPGIHAGACYIWGTAGCSGIGGGSKILLRSSV
jgi:hypothetical protein